jgi:hypothetical protein
MSKDTVQKHTINLYEGDFARLGELYPDVGASMALRTILRKHIEDRIPKVDVSKVKVEI